MKKRFLTILATLMVAVSSVSAFKTDTLTISGANYLPQDMKVTVITPTTEKSLTGYPSVYLLNGYDGDYKSWGIIRPDLGELADQYGMLFVMPSGMDSWYWDAPANPKMKMESFFTEVLVPYIDKNYPTDQRAENRAIMGLSMGGHGGLWLGMRHPDIWKNCGSTSGGVNIIPFPDRWKMKNALGTYAQNPARWKSHTVINLVPTLKPGQNNIIFDCGTDDFFAKVNSDLHDALVKAKIPHDYISRPGGHSFKYWANALPYQLQFFKNHFVK